VKRVQGARDRASMPRQASPRASSTDAPVEGSGTLLDRALRGFEGTHVALFSRVYLDDVVIASVREAVCAAAGREVAVDVFVNPRMDAGAVLHIGPGKQVVLDAQGGWLADIERAAGERREAGELESPDATYEFLEQMLSSTRPVARLEELLDVGFVLEVGDGVARVSGLKNAGAQEVVEFEGGVLGLAFSLMREEVGCILLGPEEGVREGGAVHRTGQLLRVPVGEALLGRIVNALGEPVDGREPLPSHIYRPIERKAPGVVERLPVDTPLQTGIKILDSLVPLGRGQRELIIGDRKIGKTTLAIDAIISQRGTGVRCIYVAIGQKASSVARVVRILEQAGAMSYTTVVVALPNEQPAFRYVAPYAGCAMGEYYMERGEDALVVYDDLSKHAVTYREMSALLKRPIGREAYPGDIFYVHSRLLERASRLSEERGGGSLSALPIVETLAGDISAFIPTNVISICDGQIVLDSRLFNEGFRPAMDVGLSVSRVGGAAQTKAMKQVAGRLRVDIAQYQEMAQFVKLGAEVDSATLQQLTRGARCREILRQPPHTPIAVEHQIILLFTAIDGLLDDVSLERLPELEPVLLSYAQNEAADVIERIRTTGELDDADTVKLRAVLETCVGSWLTEAARRTEVETQALTGASLAAAAAAAPAGPAAEPRASEAPPSPD
jgi:F-type H+/Na+-transporting ATPase subunit alpha